MPYRTSAKNSMLNHLNTVITTASLHTAYPPSDANEIAATNGARQAIDFNAAAAGSMGSTAEVSFDVPAGVTVSAVAYRSAGGAIEADDDVPDEVFNGAGVYRVTAATLDLNAV